MTGASILVADGDETSARFLQRLLTREGHHVHLVTDGDGVLGTCAANPPDLVLLDLIGARGKALEVCRGLKSQASTRLIPVVIVTSPLDQQERLRAIEAGADDFVVKPFEAAELRARIHSLLRLKRFTDDLESAESIILGLGATIEARDPCTLGHCERLAGYATALGRTLGLDDADLDALDRGGFLHDIGKIAVPDRILLKNGSLDASEIQTMREHPIVGDTLCAGLRSLKAVRPIVRHHHERLDGTGYPDGLRRGQVPLLAQIVAIVDIFDALTNARPYRSAISRDAAFEVLADEATKGWRDRALVDAFVAVALSH